MEKASASGFTVLVTERVATPVVAVSGEVDLHAAPRFRSALQDAESKARAGSEADSGRPSVIVDLSGVEFMDSSGIGVLIGHHRELEEAGGELRLVTGEAAMKILRLTSLDKVFSVYGSREEAFSDLPGLPESSGRAGGSHSI